MVTVIQSTDIISSAASTTAFSVNAGETAIVTAGTRIMSSGTGSDALWAGGSTYVTINGDLFGDIYGVYLAGSSNVVDITGTVESNGDGLEDNIGDNTIIVSQTGNVSGVDIGIYLVSGTSLDNSGSVLATGADGNGVSSSGNVAITNHGLIRGDGTAIYLDTGGNSITNDGTIEGKIQIEGASSNFIINRGLCGEIDLSLSTNNNFIYNYGEIDGAVDFGKGNDLFDGRNGTSIFSFYAVSGGAGKDVLFGSETSANSLAGGKGHDTLVGGSSSDRFIFAEKGTGDSDVIRHFNPGQDEIEFLHSVFHSLDKGTLKNAEFHMGASAATPDQHVIYDPQNGALYYDANGSHSGSAVLIAMLGAHLHVTADDFFVI
jgi:hypothetical protein